MGEAFTEARRHARASVLQYLWQMLCRGTDACPTPGTQQAPPRQSSCCRQCLDTSPSTQKPGKMKTYCFLSGDVQCSRRSAQSFAANQGLHLPLPIHRFSEWQTGVVANSQLPCSIGTPCLAPKLAGRGSLCHLLCFTKPCRPRSPKEDRVSQK